MYKTATVFGRGHRPPTLLNLLGSFFHSPTFSLFQRSSSTSWFPSRFHLASCLFILRYFSSSTASKRDAIVIDNSFSTNFSILFVFRQRSLIWNKTRTAVTGTRLNSVELKQKFSLIHVPYVSMNIFSSDRSNFDIYNKGHFWRCLLRRAKR